MSLYFGAIFTLYAPLQTDSILLLASTPVTCVHHCKLLQAQSFTADTGSNLKESLQLASQAA